MQGNGYGYGDGYGYGGYGYGNGDGSGYGDGDGNGGYGYGNPPRCLTYDAPVDPLPALFLITYFLNPPLVGHQ